MKNKTRKMQGPPTPLMNDGLDGQPSRRALDYIEEERWGGKPAVGVYCGYAPVELIRALDLVPAILCAFSNRTIATAETVLPANLCPLIKSSFGFIQEGTCPFYGMSEAVIGETTCDGKKKMFELISDIKPTHVMDLPQLADEPEALANWTAMIRKLQAFLEATFARTLSDDRLEAELHATNEKNRLMRRLFSFAAHRPPLLSWREIYDVTFLAQPASGAHMVPRLEELIGRLEERRAGGVFTAPAGAPGVLVTGCPVGGDATKVFDLIEGAGAAVVALDICTGMKVFMDDTAEGTGDPVRALAERYLKIPCACMTPNTRRLAALSGLIHAFEPDAVIDVVLQFCHTYSVESHKVRRHVTDVHGLPYLKIETDYGEGDLGQLRTRVEAFAEML